MDFIESFNGRLGDECLNVEVLFTLGDVHEKLLRWQEDYNLMRPHSPLQGQASATFATGWVATLQIGHTSHELLETLR